MGINNISWTGIGLRFLFALALVFATYNPEGYSFFHWGIKEFYNFTALKGFVGVVLIIGWTIFIRATLNSLGAIGLILACAFFGTLVWLMIDFGWVPTDSIRIVSYVVLFVTSCVLTVGMIWSHVRRRLTGQLDVDEIEEI